MGRLVGYRRVSSETQADEGFGLEVQTAQVEAFAAGAGHTIEAWFEDVITGKLDAVDRPGLAAALAAVEDAADGLVVAKLDRLARQLTVQEAVLAQVWKSAGRAVYTVDLGEVRRDDPDDPMRTAMRQMVGVFAQLERATIAARLRSGRRFKHSQGRYAGYGSPPFGTRTEARELVTDDIEAATVARIVELHATGLSLRQICSVLDGEGKRPKRGDRWWPRTVARVLARSSVPAPTA